MKFGNYYLHKKGILVGECVIMSENYVVYQLYKNIIPTYETTVDKILKKYKLIRK